MKVLAPTGVVISISGWMIDPFVCGGMTIGAARVDLAALIELNRLVTGSDKPALSRGGRRITQEEDDEIPQYAGAAVRPAARPDIQPRTLDGLSNHDRKKAILTLACLLMQAAGLVVEELNDDQH